MSPAKRKTKKKATRAPSRKTAAAKKAKTKRPPARKAAAPKPKPKKAAVKKAPAKKAAAKKAPAKKSRAPSRKGAPAAKAEKAPAPKAPRRAPSPRRKPSVSPAVGTLPPPQPPNAAKTARVRSLHRGERVGIVSSKQVHNQYASAEITSPPARVAIASSTAWLTVSLKK